MTWITKTKSFRNLIPELISIVKQQIWASWPFSDLVKNSVNCWSMIVIIRSLTVHSSSFHEENIRQRRRIDPSLSPNKKINSKRKMSTKCPKEHVLLLDTLILKQSWNFLLEIWQCCSFCASLVRTFFFCNSVIFCLFLCKFCEDFLQKFVGHCVRTFFFCNSVIFWEDFW